MSDTMARIVSLIESEIDRQPSPCEFELAYQARIAMDRIRYAIRTTEQAGGNTEQLRNAGMQLLDALDRLESADRRFQQRTRCANPERADSKSRAPTAKG